MDYLSTLNEPQYEGVVNTEGPAMIIAGLDLARLVCSPTVLPI
jgi:hypothetical protein